jgi:hypothetical protein
MKYIVIHLQFIQLNRLFSKLHAYAKFAYLKLVVVNLINWNGMNIIYFFMISQSALQFVIKSDNIVVHDKYEKN